MNMPVPNKVFKQTMSVQELMAQHGKTFWWAAQLLSKNTRDDAATLYAYVRVIDDLVDDLLKTQPCNDNKLAEQILTHAAQNTLGYDVVEALFVKHDISPSLMRIFVRQQIKDTLPARIDDEKALFSYCYGVAGVIGQMMRPILKADNASTPHAVALGLAMQMTNIARDVTEDAKAGRIYLPASYFSKKLTYQNIAETSEANKTVIFAAIKRLLYLADHYYKFARHGYLLIPFRNRVTIHVAANLYQAIGHKIIKRGITSYWQGRVSINVWQKTYLSAAAITETVFALLKPKQVHMQVNDQMTNSKVIQLTVNHLCAQHLIITQQVNDLITKSNVA